VSYFVLIVITVDLSTTPTSVLLPSRNDSQILPCHSLVSYKQGMQHQSHQQQQHLDGAAGPTNSMHPHRIASDRQCLTWSRVTLSSASCLPPPRSGAASVVVRGKLFMFGVSTGLLTRPVLSILLFDHELMMHEICIYFCFAPHEYFVSNL
jgi:hypothetical protein